MELNDNIPHIRQDLQVNALTQDGEMVVELRDPLGIADFPVVVSLGLFQFLYSIDKNYKFQDAERELNNKDTFDSLVANIEFLDNHSYLASVNFQSKLAKVRADYELLEARPMLTAGFSYPAAKEEFIPFIEKIFSHAPETEKKAGLKGLILPHIDLNIGEMTQDIYGKAYKLLQGEVFDTFVVFGTSHQLTNNLIAIGKKDYDTPLGTIETDKELINELGTIFNDAIGIDDFTHKNEHSIEYHAIFLKYLFPERNIKILPIIVSEHDNRDPELQGDEYEKTLEAIKLATAKLGRNAFYIGSGDFAHIGLRFNNDFAAKEKFNELRAQDKKLIDLIERGNRESFYSCVKADCNKWNVCGGAPIYLSMSAANSNSAELLSYEIWDDAPTESAVSFASLALF